ncbi:MAG: hypothetical protein ACT4OL_09195, partial [Nitrospiraceae bacterium]
MGEAGRFITRLMAATIGLNNEAERMPHSTLHTSSMSTRGTVVGALGTVLSTVDGGAIWAPQEAQEAVTLFDVFFTDPSNE